MAGLLPNDLMFKYETKAMYTKNTNNAYDKT